MLKQLVNEKCSVLILYLTQEYPLHECYFDSNLDFLGGMVPTKCHRSIRLGGVMEGFLEEVVEIYCNLAYKFRYFLAFFSKIAHFQFLLEAAEYCRNFFKLLLDLHFQINILY